MDQRLVRLRCQHGQELHRQRLVRADPRSAVGWRGHRPADPLVRPGHWQSGEDPFGSDDSRNTRVRVRQPRFHPAFVLQEP
ncbi:hypothetical protein D3C87_1242910 [compost metagenome]